jgi:hypothetical protein
MDGFIQALLGPIMGLLYPDMARDHKLVRAYPRHRRRLNRRVQRALRAAIAAQGTLAATSALAQPPPTEPSYMSMEPLPPYTAHFTPTVRSNDLGRFYGRTEGVTPLSANGDACTSHMTTSAPLEGSTIIDLNTSATTPPSLTPATTAPSHNELCICSPPSNPNPNGSPSRLSPLGNWITHRVIQLPSTSICSRSATTPQRVVTDARPFDSTVPCVRIN